jgi:hypothetical protein
VVPFVIIRRCRAPRWSVFSQVDAVCHIIIISLRALPLRAMRCDRDLLPYRLAWLRRCRLSWHMLHMLSWHMCGLASPHEILDAKQELRWEHPLMDSCLHVHVCIIYYF